MKRYVVYMEMITADNALFKLSTAVDADSLTAAETQAYEQLSNFISDGSQLSVSKTEEIA